MDSSSSDDYFVVLSLFKKRKKKTPENKTGARRASPAGENIYKLINIYILYIFMYLKQLFIN